MAEYDNTNRGVLFKNDQGGNPKRPQYRGSLNVGGTDYNISAWIKESRKDGSKFMSLSVEPKKEAKPKVQVPVQDFVDDELPPF